MHTNVPTYCVGLEARSTADDGKYYFLDCDAVWSGRSFDATYFLHPQNRRYSKEATSNKLVGYLPGLLLYPEEGRPFLRSVD
jgi:hypothetical protein